MRERLRVFIAHPRVQALIIVLILVNSVLLGLETSPTVMAAAGGFISMLDRAILALFVVEIVLRLWVYRGAFWRDPWSIFDFVVVGIALLPAAGPFAVLRALRVLRVMRLLTIVPSMRRVVGALLAAIPGLGSIVLMLGVIYYVFAVIATNLFAADFPDWFGHIGRSLYTLFQVMTLESWSMGISRPVMESFPYAWAFFVPFILVATFTILNLFIAIIVDTMQKMHAEEKEETEQALRAITHEEAEGLAVQIRHLRREVGELRRFLDRDPGPSA